MANQNPQMTFGGPNPPLTLYLTNESRSRKRGARGSGDRKRAIVLDGGIRVPTVGRTRAVGVHTIIRSLQRVLDCVREGNLKVYQDPGKQKEVTFAELMFLGDRNTVQNVSTIGRGRAAAMPDPELAKSAGVDNKVVIAQRARQEAELEARRQVAEDLEEKSAAARKEVDRQEAWMEYRALMDVANPDLAAIELHLEEAAKLAPLWLPNAKIEFGALKATADTPDDVAPVVEPPHSIAESIADDVKTDELLEAALSSFEPPPGDSGDGEPTGPHMESPDAPPPQDPAPLTELDAGGPDLPDPEPEGDEGEEGDPEDDAGEPGDENPDDGSEDVTEELSLEELKGMKRGELEQLAEKHGIENPGDRSLYPNIGVLAESLMSHVAGEAEEDENNG